MPRGRLELPRAHAHQPIKMACLPFPPPRHGRGGRIRTHGRRFWRPLLYQTELRPFAHNLTSRTPGATRTPDTRFRKPLLYPPELQGLGGDRGTRTPNLRDANAALSQLSYIPIVGIVAGSRSNGKATSPFATRIAPS
jgi:hypothetical protein